VTVTGRSTLALVLLLGDATFAHAEAPEVERVALSFRAPAQCGGSEALAERVSERSERVVFEAHDGANAVDVRIEDGPPFEAKVRVRTETEANDRELSADGCRELLDAIALVVVVTFDPSGRLPSETPAPSPPGTPSQPARAVAPATEAKPTDTAPVAPASELPPDPVPADPVTPPELGSAFDGFSAVPDRVALEAGARAHDGAAPALLVGPELGCEFSFAPERVASLRVALEVSRAWTTGVSFPEGSAEFTLDQASLELCPLRIGQRRWELRPCLNGSLGRMIARGSDTDSPREVERPWRSLGASGSFAVELLAPVWLSGSFGVSVPLVRDRYAFRPTVFYEVPAQERTFALGVSVAIP
jgi:hypothetical protein